MLKKSFNNRDFSLHQSFSNDNTTCKHFTSYLKIKMSNVTPLYKPIAHHNLGDVIITVFITVMSVIRNMKINMAWLIGAFVVFHC